MPPIVSPPLALVPFIARLVVIPVARYTSEFVIDNYIRDKIIEPAIGGIVYTDLALGFAEHSGIYLGAGKIMEFDSSGNMSVVSPSEFMKGMTGKNIYTSCYSNVPVGSKNMAQRALDFQDGGSGGRYNLFKNNCHMFTASCITGKKDKSEFSLTMLKNNCKKYMGVNNWRIWDFNPDLEINITQEAINGLNKTYLLASLEMTKFLMKLSQKSYDNAIKPKFMNLFRSEDKNMEKEQEIEADIQIRIELHDEIIEGLDEAVNILEAKIKKT